MKCAPYKITQELDSRVPIMEECWLTWRNRKEDESKRIHPEKNPLCAPLCRVGIAHPHTTAPAKRG
jgi:hypothetical protein